MENQSSKTQSFFSQVVRGESKTHNPTKKFIPFNHFHEGMLDYLSNTNAVYEGFAGCFDNHIACSIPTFRECQLSKAHAIRHTEDTGAHILDIGGSEGTFLKTVAFMAKDLNCYNLEPNKDMVENFNKFRPTNCHIVPQAFLEGFDDIEAADIPDNSFDVINETMTFQFIKRNRLEFVTEVARILKEDGVFFTEEKFQHKDAGVYARNERKKDTHHKKLYFTKDQITAKAEEVLVGMSELQALSTTYVSILEDQFKYVYEYWSSGNFKGYLCTNSKAALEVYTNYLDANLVWGHRFTKDRFYAI